MSSRFRRRHSDGDDGQEIATPGAYDALSEDDGNPTVQWRSSGPFKTTRFWQGAGAPGKPAKDAGFGWGSYAHPFDGSLWPGTSRPGRAQGDGGKKRSKMGARRARSSSG